MGRPSKIQQSIERFLKILKQAEKSIENVSTEDRVWIQGKIWKPLEEYVVIWKDQEVNDDRWVEYVKKKAFDSNSPAEFYSLSIPFLALLVLKKGKSLSEIYQEIQATDGIRKEKAIQKIQATKLDVEKRKADITELVNSLSSSQKEAEFLLAQSQYSDNLKEKMREVAQKYPGNEGIIVKELLLFFNEQEWSKEEIQTCFSKLNHREKIKDKISPNEAVFDLVERLDETVRNKESSPISDSQIPEYFRGKK